MKNNLPQLLMDLASEVDQGFLEDTFEVQNHKYRLRLLSDGEANWRNRYIDGLSSALAIMSQRKVANLAVAIRAIDGQDVVAMFTPSVPAADAPELEKQDFKIWSENTALERQFSVAKKLYDFLAQRPNEFTTELYAKLVELEDRRKEVIKNVKN